MKTRPEPFRLVDGRLHVEGVDLSVLAEELAGRPARVLSHAALAAAIAALDDTRSVSVARVGPPAVLAQLAEAGVWARAGSAHELQLALDAGFPPAHVIADAPVLDDGFVKDALSVGVGVLTRADRETSMNVARIAGALGLRQPPAEGAPPEVPDDAFARCGGLLAQVLQAPPDLAIDAVWERAGRAKARVTAVRTPPLEALPAEARAAAGPARRRARRAVHDVALRTLGRAQPVPARLSGLVARGDWVVLAEPDALAVRPPHPAFPMPRTVLVREASWRVLDARPMPAE